VALAASEGKTVTHVLGHSFGGKVAMAFALARPEPLERVFVIDSHPGIPKVQRGSETTMRVLELLRAAPARFPTRDAFTAFFVERGLDRGVTAWLAMNLAAEGDDFVFRLDLDAIEALLHDYLVTDGFALLEAPPPSFEGRVVVVKGGASPTVDAEAEARIRAAAEARPSNVALETIPNAGHWVHVDAPDALLAVIARHLET
jgi:pimeloyl-ACP methyl ester carboxylesterase